ncbi:hypothetical protein AB0B56_04950 [Streptosporangium canum]|uniref:hypothetical protein n=1 Tax=Streptosporangium canum TaxID=324952 RepID=UPI00342E8581
MLETVERGRRAGESSAARVVVEVRAGESRAARVVVEVLFFAAALGIVYALWG